MNNVSWGVVSLVLAGGILVTAVWGLSLSSERKDLQAQLLSLRDQIEVLENALAKAVAEPRPQSLVERGESTPAPARIDLSSVSLDDAEVYEVPVSVTNPVALAINDPEQMKSQSLARFDRSMDREFRRLEAREARTTDPGEQAAIQALKDKFLELDELWIAVDSNPSPESLPALRDQLQATMSEIIRLGRTDRRERLGDLARHVGYVDEADIAAFVQEIDRIQRDTHLDWAQLFHRAPPGGMGDTAPAQRPDDP